MNRKSLSLWLKNYELNKVLCIAPCLLITSCTTQQKITPDNISIDGTVGAVMLKRWALVNGVPVLQ